MVKFLFHFGKILRRQIEVEDYKKGTGINEDDVEKYFKSDFAMQNDCFFGSTVRGFQLKSTKELELMKDHLQLSLLLQNFGRNSEVSYRNKIMVKYK
jgi:hypothetical protein